MQNLLKNIKAKEEHIAHLETLPTIKKYNAYLYDREKLQEEYEQKKEEYGDKFQQECSHPMCYFWCGTYNDSREEVGIIRKCLRCTFKSDWEYFKMDAYLQLKQNLIYSATDTYVGCEQVDIPFKVINQEFLALESEDYSFEEIRDILYSKYTEKNEDLARNLKNEIYAKARKVAKRYFFFFIKNVTF